MFCPIADHVTPAVGTVVVVMLALILIITTIFGIIILYRYCPLASITVDKTYCTVRCKLQHSRLREMKLEDANDVS